MSFKPGVLLICACSFVIWPFLAHASWESKKDNRSFLDLKSMDEEELLDEATNVCIAMAAAQSVLFSVKEISSVTDGARQTYIDGSDYLHTIANIAAKKYGGGKVPGWTNQLLRTVGKDNPKPDECVTIFKSTQAKLEKTQQSPPIPSEKSTTHSAEERLRALKELKDKDLISNDEYEKKRAEILNEL